MAERQLFKRVSTQLDEQFGETHADENAQRNRAREGERLHAAQGEGGKEIAASGNRTADGAREIASAWRMKEDGKRKHAQKGGENLTRHSAIPPMKPSSMAPPHTPSAMHTAVSIAQMQWITPER